MQCYSDLNVFAWPNKRMNAICMDTCSWHIFYLGLTWVWKGWIQYDQEGETEVGLGKADLKIELKVGKAVLREIE